MLSHDKLFAKDSIGTSISFPRKHWDASVSLPLVTPSSTFSLHFTQVPLLSTAVHAAIPYRHTAATNDYAPSALRRPRRRWWHVLVVGGTVGVRWHADAFRAGGARPTSTPRGVLCLRRGARVLLLVVGISCITEQRET